MGEYLTKYYRFFFGVCMIAIVGLTFYVGILEGRRRGGDQVILSCSDQVLATLKIPTERISSATTTTSTTAPQGAFAGSKNGTKYYTPGCAGLQRIKPENIVWFQTVEDATLQGYTPAAC
ncbi:MAG: hypothetical protein KBB91_00555 [Candidatus Pacebacteria bacterium]|nr:hypothetical protein [Candidatus Paceibacterota bacterium]MBP9700838.1 hypothetical protein [Candidatus Paceibacterota bacterium]